jgi:hypothetical protein
VFYVKALAILINGNLAQLVLPFVGKIGAFAG